MALNMRTAVNTLDFADKEHRIPDEIFMNKMTGQLYYNTINNVIIEIIRGEEDKKTLSKMVSDAICTKMATLKLSEPDSIITTIGYDYPRLITLYKDFNKTDVAIEPMSLHAIKSKYGLIFTPCLRPSDKKAMDIIKKIYLSSLTIPLVEQTFDFNIDATIDGVTKKYYGNFNEINIFDTTTSDIEDITSYDVVIENLLLGEWATFTDIPQVIKDLIIPDDGELQLCNVMVSGAKSELGDILPASQTTSITEAISINNKFREYSTSNLNTITKIGSDIQIVNSLNEGLSDIIFLKIGEIEYDE